MTKTEAERILDTGDSRASDRIEAESFLYALLEDLNQCLFELGKWNKTMRGKEIKETLALCENIREKKLVEMAYLSGKIDGRTELLEQVKKLKL